MGRYVEPDYVESGYVEGDSMVPEVEKTKLHFFVAKGEASIEEVSGIVSNMIEDGESAMILLPDIGKSGYVSRIGSTFLGGDISAIEERISSIETAMNNMRVIVNMKAPDGTIIASPSVTAENGDYVFHIPENVSGTEYDVVLSIAPCADCH